MLSTRLNDVTFNLIERFWSRSRLILNFWGIFNSTIQLVATVCIWHTSWQPSLCRSLWTENPSSTSTWVLSSQIHTTSDILFIFQLTLVSCLNIPQIQSELGYINVPMSTFKHYRVQVNGQGSTAKRPICFQRPITAYNYRQLPTLPLLSTAYYSLYSLCKAYRPVADISL